MVHLTKNVRSSIGVRDGTLNKKLRSSIGSEGWYT